MACAAGAQGAEGAWPEVRSEDFRLCSMILGKMGCDSEHQPQRLSGLKSNLLSGLQQVF